MVQVKAFIGIGAFALLLAVAVGCGGGGGGVASESWAYTDEDVVGPGGGASSQSIQVDIYLDATTSMIGYLAGGSSAYTQFLEELESSITAGWAQASIDYFKFGTTVRPIDRSVFRDANSPAFYQERGMYESTRIDSVIERISRSEISVVITDLFQNESDVNALVSQVKNRVFRNDIDLAVLGIKSEFDGRIYDAKVPAYNYASTQGDESTYRPFYALMFGEAAKLRRLFKTLQSSPFVQQQHFTLISPYIVQDYEVDLAKTRSSRDLNMQSASDGSNRFAFNLRSGGTGGRLQADVILNPAPTTPDFSADQIELVSYRKELSPRSQASNTDSTLTQDLSMSNIRRSGDTLQATLQMNLGNEPAGMYSYKTVFRAGAINGLETPAWVKQFSSENPSPKNEPNKTLNLEKFVSDLIQASSSVQRPKLAKAYITVRKL